MSAENHNTQNDLLESADMQDNNLRYRNDLIQKINAASAIPDYAALSKLFKDFSNTIPFGEKNCYISNDFILYKISEILIQIILNKCESTDEAIEMLIKVSTTENQKIINDLIENGLFSVLNLLFHQEISEDYCIQAFAILENSISDDNISSFYENFDLSLIEHFLVDIQREDIKMACLVLLQKLAHTLPAESFPPILSYIIQIFPTSSISIQTNIVCFLILSIARNDERKYIIEGLSETGILNQFLHIYNQTSLKDEPELIQINKNIAFLVIQVLTVNPTLIDFPVDEIIKLLKKLNSDDVDLGKAIMRYIFNKIAKVHDEEEDNFEHGIDEELLHEFAEKGGIQITLDILANGSGPVKSSCLYLVGLFVSEMSPEQILEFINGDILDLIIDNFEPVNNELYLHVLLIGILCNAMRAELFLKVTNEIARKLDDEGFLDTLHEWINVEKDSRLHPYSQLFEETFQYALNFVPQD